MIAAAMSRQSICLGSAGRPPSRRSSPPRWRQRSSCSKETKAWVESTITSQAPGEILQIPGPKSSACRQYNNIQHDNGIILAASHSRSRGQQANNTAHKHSLSRVKSHNIYKFVKKDLALLTCQRCLVHAGFTLYTKVCRSSTSCETWLQPRCHDAGHLCSAGMGVSKNRGPQYSTLISRILIVRTPKYSAPNFRKLPI